MKLHIAHLYQKEMNIYGDNGNVETIEYRLKKRGIEYKTTVVNVGDNIPSDADIIIGGGGQDSGQFLVQEDLLKKKDQIRKMASDGVVMLMICGMYQLFGDKFITNKNITIEGIGVLPVTTKAGDKRLIGNVVADSDFGRLVGYENHSGETFLSKDAQPLAKVIKGSGNNSASKNEGCIINNVFGSYMHGPLLPKNPKLADELILRAARRHQLDFNLIDLDDSLEDEANEFASTRTR